MGCRKPCCRCATRRCHFGRWWKTTVASPSSRRGEAGDSLNRGSPGRARAASTKSGRPSTAGSVGARCARRKCIREEPASASWSSCRLQSGGYGLVSGAQPSGGAGNSRSGIDSLGRDATAKVYGVVVARPVAGAEPCAQPVNRTAVNVGTARVRSTRPGRARPGSGDRRDACRWVRVGRSRRGTPIRGEPGTGGKDASVPSKMRSAVPEEAPVNTGAVCRFSTVG